MATTPVFLPGEFHGQRSLVGYSSWGLKESGQDRHNGQDRAANNTLMQIREPSYTVGGNAY